MLGNVFNIVHCIEKISLIGLGAHYNTGLQDYMVKLGFKVTIGTYTCNGYLGSNCSGS